MERVYVVGGRQRSERSLLSGEQNWYDYQKGVILSVDLKSGRADTCVEYVSPPEACAPGDPVLFKCASRSDGKLYACTQTEVITYTLPDFKQVGYISLPCFNDVHHVLPTSLGNLLVANSGLEMILEIQPDGQVLREWNVLGEDPWGKYSKEIDYRKGVNLKPHRAHPNHVFYIGEEIWTTRFEKKDLICLTHPNKRIPVGIERIHDGVLHDGKIYLTAVDGHLVIANPDSLQVEEILDLTSLQPEEETLLGWCRGLLFDGIKVWVGFSRIRPTKFREAVSWVRQGFSKSLPTHIAAYDLQNRRLLTEIDLETFGLNAVFSIHPGTDGGLSNE